MTSSLFLFLLVLPTSVYGQIPSMPANSNDIPSLARSLALGESFILTGISLDGQETTRNLVLQRFSVFAPSAKVVLQTANGPQEMAPPDTAYFSGFIEGSPNSYAYFSVREDDSMRGLVGELGRYFMMAAGNGTGVESSRLFSREVAPDELEEDIATFVCESDNFDARAQKAANQSISKPVNRPKPMVFPNRGKMSNKYQTSVAIETDNEYYTKFGNATDATNYLGDLIAFTSGLYDTELNTSIVISHVSLWAPGVTDPWSGTSSTCLLYQLGKYWNDNNSGIGRSFTHFVSGRSSNSGVAWVGVLCNNAFNVNTSLSGCGLSPTTSNYGGDYGFSGGIDGNFNINSPASIWDIIVVAHELGHNFDSPHTHCYAGLNGSASQIDTCFTGQTSNTYTCATGSASLPSGCPGSGMGCGTIMSYCHFLSGGLSNISLTLGLGHPYGVSPDRVPTRMGNHVSSINGFDPGCLPELYPSILANWPTPSSILDILDVLF